VSVLARLEALFPVEHQPQEPASPGTVELAARAHAAALHGDEVAAGRIVDRMLADGWWRPVLEAAVLREMARARGPATSGRSGV
jgi:glycerol dehydrogenase-like iron-containing ADH family enzyme